MSYVEPEQYGLSRLGRGDERLKRINAAATVFAPQQLVPSEAAQSVIVIAGACAPWSTASRQPTNSKAYLIEFSHAGARMHLKAFRRRRANASKQSTFRYQRIGQPLSAVFWSPR